MSLSVSNFTDIEDAHLRGWNRAIVAANIRRDCGKAAMKIYLEQFPEGELADVLWAASIQAALGRREANRYFQYCRGMFVGGGWECIA